MKISSSTSNYISQSYANQQNSAANRPQNTSKSGQDPKTGLPVDSINLSGKTKDLQKISAAMEIQPAGRAQYISEIKQRIETNHYTINAEAIAGKMAGTIMNETG